MGKCRIMVNGKEHLMMSELADYIDNSKQGSRSVQKIADILKGSKSLTQFQGKPELFATQEQRNELNLINQRYPNLISMPFETVTNVRTFAGKPTNIYKVIINQDILNRAIEVFEANVNSRTITSKGSGNCNTTLDITDVAATSTNLLALKITTTATSDRVFGAAVTIA